MRIALMTSGRFTLVDLARELSVLGHDVKVYSLVPPSQTRKFGLPDRCNRWLGVHCLPFYAGLRYLSDGALKDLSSRALLDVMDRTTSAKLEPCDAVIAMSGMCVRALDEARQRFGARIFVERSSVHILAQREIVQRFPGMSPEFSKHFRYERELLSYALADVITLPSLHTYQSFLDRGYAPERLFRNPFGVSLNSWQPTAAPPTAARPTILMTGAWCLRKGCDVLVEAWRKLPGTRLLHVGPVVDAALPDDALFEHVNAVPQSELRNYYAQGDVFALASREEGLAVVQGQALACGLPLVCTTMTGGADLAAWTERDNAVRVVPPENPDALAGALGAALAERPEGGSVRDQLGRFRGELSWAASARRYERKLLEVVGG